MATKETTAIYQWQGDGIIQRVDIRTQDNGRAVAYIYANDNNARQPERNAVRTALRGKGWGTLSDHSGDQFSLRVSGLKDGQELIDLIMSQGHVAGAPVVTNTATAKEQSKGTWNYIRDHSLTISGTIATVGNSMSIASGFARGKELNQIGQGAAFAVADLPLAIAGGRDDSRQLSDLLRQLKKHYIKEGIDIPDNASIHAETSNKNKSVGELSKDYLHRYANQVKCSMEVVAAAFTINAGKAQDSKWKKYTPFVWGSGFLASLIIPERKIDDKKYAQAGLLGRGWMLVQSNPLSIGGLLGYSNTVATYASAINERNHHIDPKKYPPKMEEKTGLPKDYSKYGWDFAIPSVMIGANGTYMISKKSAGGNIENDTMVNDVYSVAAQIINKQPDDQRQTVIESTAKFLGERTEIKDTHSEIIARLNKEVLIQRQNPWFENTRLAIRPLGVANADTKQHPAAAISNAAPNAEVKPSVKETPTTAIHVASTKHDAKIDIAREPQTVAAL